VATARQAIRLASDRIFPLPSKPNLPPSNREARNDFVCLAMPVIALPKEGKS